MALARIPLSGNFTFSWSGDQIVDYYYLTFYKKTKDGKPHGVLAVGGIRSNSISLLDTRKAKVLQAAVDYGTLKKLGVFKRTSGDLALGDHSVGVIGVVDLPTESRYFEVTQSDIEPIVHLY